VKKVLFVIFGGANKPSCRYRVFQFLDHIHESPARFQYKTISTPQKSATRHYPRFLRGVMHAIELVKFYLLILYYCIRWADKAFIQKTVLPKIVMELVIKSKTPFIYDFDDAIYVPFSTTKSSKKSRIKNNALAFLLKNAETVIAGNQVLQEYALRFRSECEVIPTVIDLQKYSVQKDYHSFNYSIGWIGTSQNLVFLNQIAQPLRVLRQEFPQLKLLVICDKPYELDDIVINKPWGKETEISDMLLMDIGIMPLSDDEWTRGKCSFKAIQYMALGIPAIASPVGMNMEVIKNGVNGYLADTEEEWIIKLRNTICNQSLRQTFSLLGREQVETKYSLQAWLDRWFQIVLAEKK
jgi:glycosyltransferase involved in cell wall biosynthesis